MHIAVVTGASSGIGRCFALELAKREPLDELWAIALPGPELDSLQAELSIPVRLFPYDLTDSGNLQRYAALLESEQPCVSVLVNAAGFGQFALSTAVPLDISCNMVDLNTKALLSVCQLTLPYMRRGGSIINMGSLSAFQPVPYINVYGATKAFVLSYSRALGVELRPRGIRVIAACPGWVNTPFFKRAVVDPNAVTYYNSIWKPQDVVARAFHDLARGRDVSILGFPIRLQVFLTKLLPHKWIMAIWMRQQKHNRRPAED